MLTINLPDDLERKLRQYGAFVPDVIERALRNELKALERSSRTVSDTLNVEKHG